MRASSSQSWRALVDWSLPALLLILVSVVVLVPVALGENQVPLARWPCHAVDTGKAQACAPARSIRLSQLQRAESRASSVCAANTTVCYLRDVLASYHVATALRERVACVDQYCCFTCNPDQHGAARAVDDDSGSFWQSGTLSSLAQQENLEIDLPGEFLLTSVNVEFGLSRPAAVRIQVSSDGGGAGNAATAWKTLHHYADNCRLRYGKEPGFGCTQFNTSTFDISLEMSQQRMLESRVYLIEVPTPLQHYVIRRVRIAMDNAASIPIEELDSLQATMQSANAAALFSHYSLASVHVDGLCYCNGHAELCNSRTGKCQCVHNTAGAHCERCMNLYNEKPWIRASDADTGVCKACTCNDHAKRCHFDQRVFNDTGNTSGGVCVNCQHHTHGLHCQNCNPLFYRQPHVRFNHPLACLPCDCNPYGILPNTTGCSLATGQCHCAAGYSGRQCSTCGIPLHYTAPAYHHTGTAASVCKPCRCDQTGSLTPHCDGDGWCACKPGVGGLRCSQCKEGFFNLTVTGCRRCSCDPRGSTGCSSTSGACFCKPNISGERCTHCAGGSRYIGEEAIFGCFTPDHMVPSAGLDVKYMAILAVMVVSVTFIIALAIYCIVRYRQKRKMRDGRLVRFASERVLAQSRPLDTYVSEGPCIDSPSSVAQRQVSDCTIFENPLRADERHDSSTSDRPPFKTRQSAPAMMGLAGSKELREEMVRRASTPEIAMFLNEAFGQEMSDTEDVSTDVPQRRSRVFNPRRADRDSTAEPQPNESNIMAPSDRLRLPNLPIKSPGASSDNSVKRAQSFNTKKIGPPKPARSPMRSHSLRTCGSLPQLVHAASSGRALPAAVPTRRESLDTENTYTKASVPIPIPTNTGSSSTAELKPLQIASHYRSAPVLPLALQQQAKKQPPPVRVRRRELPKVPAKAVKQQQPQSADTVHKLGARSSPSAALGDSVRPHARPRSCTTPDSQAGRRDSTSRARSQQSSPKPPPRRRKAMPRRVRSNSMSALSGLYSSPGKASYENGAATMGNGGAACQDCRVDVRKARSCQLSADSYDGNWEDSDNDDEVPAVPDRTQASYQLYITNARADDAATAAATAGRVNGALKHSSLPEKIDPYDCTLPYNPYETLRASQCDTTGVESNHPGRAGTMPNREHAYETLQMQKPLPYTSLINRAVTNGIRTT
ncbi:laminin subunit beta-1-like [Sycon ciliatum]|uniref:laminin subunit beta-1-like n=1 Tax=Sycon ciliatum TaxID=27933 RepID=UPI0031F630F7